MKCFLFITCLFLFVGAKAQTTVDSLQADSVKAIDQLRIVDSLQADSLSRIPPPKRDSLRPVLQYPFTSDSFLFRKRLFFSFTNPVRYSISEKRWEGKDVVFYTVVGVLLLFALLKNSFRRYVSDLFGSYFRTTVRQRQIKEQLLQNPLPSLLFNAFFVVNGALFLALLFQHFSLAGEAPFWLLAAYAAGALAIVYAGKFVVLKFFGWAFQFSDLTDVYIFIVFSTNKILGIVLLPFVVLLGFTEGAVGAAAATLSLIVVVGLFAYRYFLSYISINRNMGVNFFHFLLYLAALEVLPLLLINKLLFVFLREIS